MDLQKLVKLDWRDRFREGARVVVISDCYRWATSD